MYSDTGSLGNDYLVSGSYKSINFHIDPNIKFNYSFFLKRISTSQTIPTLTSATV